MNVLFLDQFSEIGGAQRCLLDLLPAVAARGWNAHLAAPGDGPLSEHAANYGATTNHLRFGPYSSGRKNLTDTAHFVWETPRLSRVIGVLARHHKADLLYVNGPRLLPAIALAGRRGPPVFFHAHSYLQGATRKLVGYSLRSSRARVVAASRFVGEPLNDYADVRIVYNGVPPCEGARRAKDQPCIGVIGRIAPEKGQADFLRAARVIHRSLPDCRFVICGAPLFSNPAAVRYGEELKTLAEGLPVEFTGWLDNSAAVLAALDLLVVPSAPVDATPRVILEAFAAGVPVIAFAAGGIPEIIEHSVTGFLIESRSPDALASAILNLLSDSRRLLSIADRAGAKVVTEFSLERYQGQMLEAMEQAARG